MQRVLPIAAALGAALLMLVGGTASGYGPAPVSAWVASGGFFGGGSVQAVAVSGSTAYLGGYFSYVGPSTGSFVSVNRATGALTSPWPVVGGVGAVVSDGAGGWFIGGTFGAIGNARVGNLAHIKADGTLDTAWTGSVESSVRSIALSGGILYAGGDFTAARSGGGSYVNRAHLAAFDASTGAPTSFNPFPSMSQNGTVMTIELSGTTLYVGGDFESIGSQTRSNLAAVDLTTGSLTSWAPSVNQVVSSIAVSGGGTVYVGGYFDEANGSQRLYAAAFDQAGALAAWNPGLDGPVNAVEVSGANVYLGGGFFNTGLEEHTGLVAVGAVSATPTSWNPQVDGTVYSLLASGSTVYAGGTFEAVGGLARDNLAAFDTAGTGAPTAFAPVIGGLVGALAVNAGTVAVSGGFTTAGSSSVPSLMPVRRSNLAAIDLTTGKPTSWHPSVDDGFVFALALAGPNLIVGGDFSTVNGSIERNDLASFSLSTAAATAWNPDVLGRIYAMTVNGPNVYVGGQFEFVNGTTPRGGLAAFSTSGTGTALPWSPSVGASANVLALDSIGDTIYAGGDFMAVSGASRTRLAAIGTDGAVKPWNPVANDQVYSLAHSGSTVYAGGGFTTVNGGLSRPGLAAFDAVGPGTVTAWNPQVRISPGLPARVFALAPTASALYLGGDFRTVGDCAVSCVDSPELAAVSLSTGAPLGWHPAADNIVWALGVAPQGLVAGGYFNTVGISPDLPVPPADSPSYQSGYALLPVPPGPPGVSVTRGDRSLTVTVTAPVDNGGAAITLYTVSISPGGASATISDPGGSATFTGLTNGAPYTVSATATSSAGTGPATVVSATPGTSVREPEPPAPPAPTPRPDTPAPPAITTRPPPPHHGS